MRTLMSDFAKRWLAALRVSDKPAYLAIADLDRRGRIRTRPPHAARPPAAAAQSSPTTSTSTTRRSRAATLKRAKRGLIDARAGHGTFIRASAAARSPARRRQSAGNDDEPAAGAERSGAARHGCRMARDARSARRSCTRCCATRSFGGSHEDKRRRHALAARAAARIECRRRSAGLPRHPQRAGRVVRRCSRGRAS